MNSTQFTFVDKLSYTNPYPTRRDQIGRTLNIPTRSLFSNGLPPLVISTKAATQTHFSSDPKDHSYSPSSSSTFNPTYNNERRSSIDYLVKALGESIKGEENWDGEKVRGVEGFHQEKHRNFTSTTSTSCDINRLSFPRVPSDSYRIPSQNPYHRSNNSMEAETSQTLLPSFEYNFPPPQYFSPSPTPYHSNISPPLLPLDQSRRDSLDSFSPSINISKRRTFSELDETYVSPKFRSSPPSNRDRRGSVSSIGSGSGSASNYYHGGIGRVHRNSLSSDVIPTIGNKEAVHHKPTLIPVIIPPSSPIFTTPNRTRTRTHSNPTTSNSPPRSVRSFATPKSSPTFSSHRLTRQQSSPKVSISDSLSTDGSSGGGEAAERGGGGEGRGGVGSSKRFSPKEQDMLWDAWKAKQFYPSHIIVDQIVEETK